MWCTTRFGAGTYVIFKVAPLEDVINSHGLNAMMYADDSHIYIFMEERDRQIAIGKQV